MGGGKNKTTPPVLEQRQPQANEQTKDR
jgi:hypothetical protein